MALEDDIAFALLIERELVLKPGAAAAADADSQAREADVCLLGIQKLVHLLGALVGDLDHRFTPVDGSKTFQSIAPCIAMARA